MATARRLRGHKDTAICCIASRDRPGVVATAGEDGCICWFDMRCKDVQFTMDLGNNPITSFCFKPGNEDVIYVSYGTEVKCFDVHLANAWKPLETYNYNKEEINQIACSSNASFLAAADDAGDIKIIDILQQRLYKTLRSGHSSICSSVQFLPWKPWEVITGGLDSKLVMWDFSKGRSHKIVDFGISHGENSNSTGQCLNPAFVHALLIPDVDMLDKTGKICIVARGDGVVDVINVETELASIRSKSYLNPKIKSPPKSKASVSTADTKNLESNIKKRLHLDSSLGGHTAAVSCLAFSLFGERGKFVISGGNDKSVKVWDWSKYLDDEQSGGKSDILHLNIDMNKKVNWLCTTPNDSENLVVCDTTKVVKVYTVS